jgi:glutamine amidotransferase
MIGILRYSAGNVGSVQRALSRLDVPSKIIEKPEELEEVDGLILPGAGAAPAAMSYLLNNNFVQPLRDFKKPFLGLCLGMQLLFESSEEGSVKCLSILKGNVCKLPRIHIGWNKIDDKSYAYFVHGYACEPKDTSLITMKTFFDDEVCAGVQKDNFMGVQWHPEKSGAIGNQFLLSFAKLCK